MHPHPQNFTSRSSQGLLFFFFMHLKQSSTTPTRGEQTWVQRFKPMQNTQTYKDQATNLQRNSNQTKIQQKVKKTIKNQKPLLLGAYKHQEGHPRYLKKAKPIWWILKFNGALPSQRKLVLCDIIPKWFEWVGSSNKLSIQVVWMFTEKENPRVCVFHYIQYSATNSTYQSKYRTVEMQWNNNQMS